MNNSSKPVSSSSKVATLFLRVALAASYLSAVADRFGLWGAAGTGEVAWGEFSSFVDYTGMLLWFLPKSSIVAFAWGATILEILFAVGLLIGIKTRLFATLSGLLLLSFALCMTFATGPEGPLSYSVWTAAAASFVLATYPVNET